MESEKKRYICDACIQMDKDDAVHILNFLHNANQDTGIFSENRDGIKINLNKLSPNVINNLYEFVKYKMKSS